MTTAGTHLSLALLALLAPAGALAKCGGALYRDWEYSAPAASAPSVRVLLSTGTIVVANSSSADLRVVVRASAPDRATLAGVSVRGSAAGGVLAVQACAAPEAAGGRCPSAIDGDDAGPSCALAPGPLALCGAALLSSSSAAAAAVVCGAGAALGAAAAGGAGCAELGATVYVPDQWQRMAPATSLVLDAPGADVALTSPLRVGALTVATVHGRASAVWEAPLTTASLVLSALGSGSTVYIARAAMKRGNGTCAARVEAEGGGAVTFSYLDMPGTAVACSVGARAAGSGAYVGMPHVRGFAGTWALSGAGASVAGEGVQVLGAQGPARRGVAGAAGDGAARGQHTLAAEAAPPAKAIVNFGV
eukprot:m51a1_g6099 hypothetical protein (362) ;mRNA; r:67662-69021